MEVSETKLVNFAEKTKFDVSSDISPPPPRKDSQFDLALRVANLDIVPPDMSSVLNSDGSWDEPRLPTIRFSRFDKLTGKTSFYDSLSDVPDLNAIDEIRIRDGRDAYVDAIRLELETMRGNALTQKVFSLDPNQLLTVSSGFKVLLGRPLDT